jgi:hypothetical protein
MAHHFTENGKLNYRKKLYLNGKNLYKVSHGNFYKRSDFSSSGILEVLKANNWISMGRYTGKNQGSTF